MPQYLLLLHEDPSAFAGVTPAQMQDIIARYTAWATKLATEGKLVSSNKLRDGEGRTLRKSGGRIAVTDGPYTESKEVIGGYFLIEAAGYDEAVAISSECPHVDYGVVEVREVDLVNGE